MSLVKSDGVVISADVEHADTLVKQIFGLMFRRGFDGALIFDLGHERYEGIHMLFVRVPIDVVFLDSSRTVVKVKAGLRPWVGMAFARFRYAIELPAGTADKASIKKGDRLSW